MTRVVAHSITTSSTGARAPGLGCVWHQDVALTSQACQPAAVQDVITNVLVPLNLLHLETSFRDNGINGQVFIYLTDVRSPIQPA